MSTSDGLRRGADGVVRCFWPGDDPLYLRYHDEEWGFPVRDDRALFEKLSLDAFQSGLSWITILRKREAFRAAFRGFDLSTVARFGARDVRRLLADAGIVRHRGKIEAVIANARHVLEIQREMDSFSAHLWGFAPRPGSRPARITWPVLRRLTTSAESVALAADLKRRGFRFVGPTVAYAFMQAVGIVNDHMEGCQIRARAEQARGRYRPGS
jgi:DNA-3-methyladenine glycosylase I